MSDFPLKGLVFATMPDGSADGKREWNFRQCTLFSEEETQKLSESLSVMDRLFLNMERSFSVQEIFQELSAELSNLKTDDIYGIKRVDRLFRTYVIEWQLFLDHWNRYISDLKKTDAEYGAVYETLFQDVTSVAYDSCDEYVLAHVIRNYVVHGYDSINHCHINGIRNQIFIGRDNLFRINVAASAKPIIQKQPDSIDLMLVAEKSMSALMTVQEQLMDYQITTSVGEAAANLLDAKQRIDEAGIEADLWMLIGDVEPKHVTTDENGAAIQREGLNVIHRRIKWPYYQMVAAYTKRLWEQGYWTEIQEKYHV